MSPQNGKTLNLKCIPFSRNFYALGSINDTKNLRGKKHSELLEIFPNGSNTTHGIRVFKPSFTPVCRSLQHNYNMSRTHSASSHRNYFFHVQRKLQRETREPPTACGYLGFDGWSCSESVLHSVLSCVTTALTPLHLGV